MTPRSAKRRGALFEQAVADWLADRIGQPVERRHLRGAADRGDLSGVTVRGHRVVLELKATTRLDIAGHLAEAERERVTDGAAVGIVVQKRRGVGLTQSGMPCQLAVMSLETLAVLLRLADGKEPGGEGDDDAR